MSPRRGPSPLDIFQDVEIRLLLLRLGVVFGVLVLIVALWKTQIIEGEEYRRLMETQSIRAQHLPSSRGLIADRYGQVLAESRPAYFLELYLKEIVRSYPKGVPIPYKKNRGGHRVEDIGKIVETRLPRLRDIVGLGKDDLPIRAIERHHNQEPFQPFRVKEDLKPEQVARFYENSPIISGADITVVSMRHYPFGELASHVLGHVGRPEKVQEPDDDKLFNFQPDFIGKQGVERMMDQYLLGQEGVRMVRVNTRGFIEGEVSVRPPKPGSTVYLTLDVRIQQIVEKALRSVGRGACVIVDVNTGEIVAMASIPEFDPNSFVPSISPAELSRLHNDKDLPMFDRALSAYAPGSIFKTVVAVAGLEKGRITPDAMVESGPGLQLGNHYFRCWSADRGGLGVINMRRAIAMSANVYFYKLGLRTGAENIEETGRKFGLGENSGLGFGLESAGIMDGPVWRKKRFPRETWTPGLTANQSIGQGSTLVTPLQMALLTATIANGGTLYKPQIISKVVDVDGNVIVENKPEKRWDTGFKMANLNVVRQGMLAVVEEGTGRSAAVPGIKVAGKTGTAQAFRSIPGLGVVKDNKTWFITFAPYDNPRYAMAIMVEGGVSGGSTCAPLAGKIWKQIFGLPPVQPGEVPAPLTEEFFQSFEVVQPLLAGQEVVDPNAAPQNPDGETPGDTPAAVEDESVEAPAPTPSPGRIRNARGLRL